MAAGSSIAIGCPRPTGGFSLSPQPSRSRPASSQDSPPGLHALRANLNPGLKARQANSTAGKLLVAAQLAISMVLVVGSVLFTDTLVQLNRVDRGLRTSGVLTFRVRSSDGYAATRQWSSSACSKTFSTKLPASLPRPPLRPSRSAAASGIAASMSKARSGPQDEPQNVAFNAIGAKYFATIGEPLLLGREFTRRDDASAPRVAIVNETFARHYLAGKSALSRRVTVGVPYQIVGVVRDARSLDLRHPPEPSMFVPWQQLGDANPINFSFLIRVTAGDPGALAPLLPALVRQADAGYRLRAVNTYDDLIGDTVITERIMAALGGFFGLLALMVACLGVLGVMAFQVWRRTNEIGIRIALGAGRGGILALILREAAVLAAAGCAIGAAAALPLTGLTQSLLFGAQEPRRFLHGSRRTHFRCSGGRLVPGPPRGAHRPAWGFAPGLNRPSPHWPHAFYGGAR